MELQFLFSIATSMLASLLGDIITGDTEQATPEQKVREQVSTVVVERKVSYEELMVPEFVTNIPEEHFAGISAPFSSLSDARRSAINEAVRQILGTIGAEYNHSFISKVSGDPHGKVQRHVNDKLSGLAHGIVMDVEKNIVKSRWSIDRSGRYVYFILVYYPESMVNEMRRLSKGANVVVANIGSDNGITQIKISETNGVCVTMTSADVTVTKKNRYAKAISKYVWKVPAGLKSSRSVALPAPIKVCGNSTIISLPTIDYKAGI